MRAIGHLCNFFHKLNIFLGFDQLLEQLNDLTLDTPESPDLLGQFIARAVADDCLPPKYLADHIGDLPEDGSAQHAE